MRRLGIDCRFAATDSGLGRFAREMISRVVPLLTDVTVVLFLPPGNSAWFTRQKNVEEVTVDIPHYSLSEQLLLPDIYRKSALDLLFVPHFNVPYFCPVPTVIAIHDLILHRYPNQASFIKRFAYRRLLKRAVERARRIVAVSKFTKREIESAYGREAADKTTVIHEGVSKNFSPLTASEAKVALLRFGVHSPYFLYVGNAKEHKNVQVLLDAFERSGRTDTELLLVTAGPETEALQLPPRARLIQGASDEDLRALYSEALCFVTASLYEGFGLPLLEAAACGCPIIATRCGAFPEVAPLGSVIVDPSITAISEAIKSPPKRRPNTEPLATWEDAARNMSTLLREALEGV